MGKRDEMRSREYLKRKETRLAVVGRHSRQVRAGGCIVASCSRSRTNIWLCDENIEQMKAGDV